MNNFTKMSVMRKLETEELKLLYVTPLTEIVQVQSEGAMMKPSKWATGEGGTIDIFDEGDPNNPNPFGDNDDGKGAKGNLWDNSNMWDD